MKLLYTITSSIVIAVSSVTASAECKSCDKEAKCATCEQGKCSKEECKNGCKCEAKAVATPDAQFAVTGMTCKMCAKKVTEVLTAIEGITIKKVCHKLGTVSVDIDEAKTNKEAVATAINATGFKVIGEKLSIPVSGMTCTKCSGKVTAAVKALEGVSSCSICHKSGHADITVDTSKTSKEKIFEAINATGFKTAAK